MVIKPALGGGAFGEYVTAPVAYTARVPAGLDLAVAGALGLAGTAALVAVADVPRALADFAAGTRGKLPSAWPDRRVQSGGRYRNAAPAGTLAS